MSYFNKKKIVPTVTNYAGGVAYTQSDRIALLNAVVTSLGNDSTYESFNHKYLRIEELVSKCDAEFVAKLAVYARKNFNVRTLPIILLTLLAKKFAGSPYIRLATRNTISRADELSEVLVAYARLNNHNNTKILNKLNNGIRRGIADAFHKFDEYQFAKYKKSDKEVSLKDTLFITHPKPFNNKEKELFEKIANDKLEAPDTWEVSRTSIGQKKLSEEDKKQAMKESWSDLVNRNKLGYMAMLRNLKNMLLDGIDSDTLDKVLSYLSNPNNIKKSKQFPYRFYSAYKVIKELQDKGVDLSYKNKNGGYSSSVTTIDLGNESKYIANKDIYTNIYKCLETCAMHSVENIPGFDNPNLSICIAADVSGSMDSKLSENSDMTLKELALLMSILVAKKSKNNDYLLFASKVGRADIGNSSKNVFELVNTLMNYKDLGYSTYLNNVFDELVNVYKKFDKIYVFTDMQVYTYDGKTTSSAWNKYRSTINDKCKLICVDLAGHGTDFASHGSNAVTVSGFSDATFKMVELVDQVNSNAGIIKEIMSIELK